MPGRPGGGGSARGHGEGGKGSICDDAQLAAGLNADDRQPQPARLQPEPAPAPAPAETEPEPCAGGYLDRHVSAAQGAVVAAKRLEVDLARCKLIFRTKLEATGSLMTEEVDFVNIVGVRFDVHATATSKYKGDAVVT